MKLETVTFSPIGHGWDWISIGFGLITLFGVSVLIYQYLNMRSSKPSEVYKSPILGLIILATALAAAAFVYSKNYNNQLNTVEISSEFIRTPFGECTIDEVKSVYIYPDTNSIPPAEVEKVTVYYLIIEEKNGYPHPLSSMDYDIIPIQRKLQEIIK